MAYTSSNFSLISTFSYDETNQSCKKEKCSFADEDRAEISKPRGIGTGIDELTRF